MGRITERDRILSEPLSLKVEGSPEWCWQQLEGLRWAYKQVETAFSFVEESRGILRQHRAWDKLPPDTDEKYGDEDTMLRSALGVDGETVAARVTAARTAAQYAETTSPALTRKEASRIGGRAPRGVKLLEVYSRRKRTPAEQLTARIRRDHPDIHQRMLAGEFAHVSDAARAAGIPVGEKPLTTLRRAWGKLTAAERKAFLAEVARD